MLASNVWEDEIKRLKASLEAKDKELLHAHGQIELERSRANRIRGEVSDIIGKKLRGQYDAYRGEVMAQYQKEVSSLNMSSMQKEEEEALLRGQVREMQLILKQKDSRLLTAEKEVTSLLPEIDKYSRLAQSYKKQLISATNELQDCKEQNATLQETAAARHVEAKRLKSEITLLQTQVLSKNENIHSLEDQLAELNQNMLVQHTSRSRRQ
eukprot:TRINITY_DN14934_c0_g1_i1.p1 TRINITY_DN14934_c0_g1~~TRINITY_DN14934_c0_g1_i1.p1  ORF type:complete len:211 (+),score=49.57 TRINITY_DN14934_c0_g1_i1:188-820(+)